MRGPSALPECCALEAVLSLRRGANGGHPALMNYTQPGWMEGRQDRGGDAAVIEAAAEPEERLVFDEL